MNRSPRYRKHSRSSISSHWGFLLLWGVPLGFLGALAGCSGEDSGDAMVAEMGNNEKIVKPLEITTSAVTIREVQRTVPATGTFTGYEDISVTPKITGNVIKVHASTGDIVHPGDLLIEIDPTDYQLAYDELYRTIEAEAARLGVDMPQEILTLPELQEILQQLATLTINDLPSVAQAAEVEKNARSQLNRGLALQANRTITEQEIETLQKEYNVAEQSLDQARFNARASVSLVRQRYAELSTAWQKIVDSRVIVPHSDLAVNKFGEAVEYRVAKRNVHEGEMVRGGVGMVGGSSAVYELVLDLVLKYQAIIPERFNGEVKIGQTVTCRVESFPDELFTGTIHRISPQIDPLNRTFEAEVQIDNSERKLTSGGYARGAITVRTDPSALTVPVGAVLTTVGTHKVFVLDKLPSDAEETTNVSVIVVKTGEEIAVINPETGSRENWIEVTPAEGEPELPPGAWVAVTNLGSLYQDAPVHLRADEPKETPTTETTDSGEPAAQTTGITPAAQP